MPLKSWTFQSDGTPVRAEIWWRYTGWSQRRVYVNHRAIINKAGWWQTSWPIELRQDGAPSRPMQIRFVPRRLGFDMDCRLCIDGRELKWDQTRVQIDRGFDHSGLDKPSSRLTENAGCLFALLLAILFLGIYVPFLLIALPCIGFWTWLSGRSEKRPDRFLSWERLKPRAQNERSTLIIRMGRESIEEWWVPDELASVSPFPVAAQSRYSSANLFADWCNFKYIADTGSSAIRTSLPPELIKRIYGRESLLDDFPLLSVVEINESDRERELQLPRLLSLLNRTLGNSIPSLLAGISDDDRALRHMCLEAIELAGPSLPDPDAGMAVAAVSEALFTGSRMNRSQAAQTLSALGASGIKMLRRAASVDDPSISKPAKGALARHDTLNDNDLETPASSKALT